MRRAYRVALSVALAVVMLAVLVTAVGWRQLLAELQAANTAWLALALVLSALSLVCWTEEVVRLFRSAGGEASGLGLRAAYLAGVFGKIVVPGGHVGGVGIVAYVLGQYTGESFERTLVAVSAGEFLNNVASATLAAIGIVYLLIAASAPASFLRAGAVAVVVLTAGLTAAYVLLVRFDGAERGLAWLAKVVRRTVGQVSTRVHEALAEERVADRLETLRVTLDEVRDDRTTLVLAVVIAHVGWLCYAVPLYCSLQAVDAGVAFPVALFVVPVAGLASIVATPGGLGPVDTATAGALVLLTSIDPAVAGAATFLFRAATFGFTVLATGVVTVGLVATGRVEPLDALRSS